MTARASAILLAAGSLTLLAAGGAGPAAADEDRVRAAFLFQLAQFAEWPGAALPPPGGPMRFCVLRHPSLAQELSATVMNKRIAGRWIAVERAANFAELRGCHLAYVGLSRPRELEEAFAHWDYPPVLLVGEADRFAESGGMVNLVIEAGRVSFDVNLAVLGRAGLGLRAQLLRFARVLPARPLPPRGPGRAVLE